MTPTHPPQLGTHRRIADLIERGVFDVPRIAAALGMQPASVTIALGKMATLGYVVRDGQRKRESAHGRAANAWAMVPGAVVPADSGSTPGAKRKSAETYVARVVDVLRAGPTTRTALVKASSIAWSQLEDVVDFLMNAGCVTRTHGATGGRPSYIYTLVREPVDPSAVTIRTMTRPPVEVSEEEQYEGTSGTFVLGTVPSAETVQCAREPRTVALAACLDGYVDATATGRQSPCNQCPTGRARRASYAGFDFEDGDDA